MNFLAPAAFFLGLLLPVIIALYLLKLRRVEQRVSSNYLWRRMVRDVEANAPWQKLRPNLLMILQLLFMAALIFALARPFAWTEGAGGQAAILIIDASASMGAVDVKPSRIEAAKQRALQLVEDLPDSARVTVIEAGHESRILVSSSQDRRQAQLAIRDIQAGTGASDLAVALQLASAVAARQPGTEIIVLSDGNVSLPEQMTVKGSLRYIPFGLESNNQAVSLVTINLSPGGETWNAFIQVSNYSRESASRRLYLYADGLLVNAFDLTDIPAGGQKSVIAEGLPKEIRVVEATLLNKNFIDAQTSQQPENDFFSLDDTAYAVPPGGQAIPVRLVTRGNLFIKTVLSLLPGIRLTEQLVGNLPGEDQDASEPTAAPAQAEIDDEAYLLTIYDGTIPDPVAPSGSLLFIAPPASTEFFTVSGTNKDPLARAVDPSDPLLHNVSLAEVNILDAVNISPGAWANPVIAGDVSGGNIPLLFRGETGGRKIAVLAFDLRHSDLPLQVAFPLLWSNLIAWLVPEAGINVPDQVKPFESLSIQAYGDGQPALITLPDGQTSQVQAEDHRYFFSNTAQLGVYQVQIMDASGASASGSQESMFFAVNLFSPQESDIQPADNLPGLASSAGENINSENQAMREWWRYPALLALGLLAGEWLVYQRAGLIRLRDILLASGIFRRRAQR